MESDTVIDDVYPPSGGWGSANAVLSIFVQEHAATKSASAMLRQNKPDGFACVSCSWATPAHPHSIEACENGLKATAWELTSKRATPEQFAKYTVGEFEKWKDLFNEHRQVIWISSSGFHAGLPLRLVLFPSLRIGYESVTVFSGQPHGFWAVRRE